MPRFLLLIIIFLSTNVFAENTNLATNEQETDVVEFSELEHRIVELSGLLSLSEQVKTSAQYIISKSTVDAEKSEPAGESALVGINHAQHFGIAQSLSKRWIETEWENRLLTFIATLDKKEQQQIANDLSQKTIQSARAKEKAAIRNQSTAEYLMYMNKLEQRPPAASRWKLVESLDAHSFFSALIVKTRERVYAEISSQVEGWQPPIGWKQEAEKEVLEFLFYAYRKTSNPDLAKIANSYQRPALQSFLTKIQAEL